MDVLMRYLGFRSIMHVVLCCLTFTFFSNAYGKEGANLDSERRKIKAAPTVVQPIPNQVAHNAEPFSMTINTYETFNDLDNDFLNVVIKQTDDSALPAWLTSEAKSIVPSLVGTYNTPGNAHGVAVAGNYAYVANHTAGLRIIDISTPSSPSLVGTYNTSGVAYGVAVAGNYAYVADETAGLQIIDISTPSSPSLFGTYNTPGYAFGVAVRGNYAYVADHIAGLKIFEGVGGGILLSGTPAISDLGMLNLKATASDGINSVSTPFSIKANHKPTITNQEYKEAQNASLQFNKEQFISAFQDDDGDELSKIQIMSLPNHGELKLSGVAVLLNQEIDVEDIDDLSFTPQTDWTGTTNFEWRGFDGITYSDEGVVTIKVSAAAIDKDWLEAWWPVVTGGTVAVIGGIVTVVSALITYKLKLCCFKKDKGEVLELEDLEIRVKK